MICKLILINYWVKYLAHDRSRTLSYIEQLCFQLIIGKYIYHIYAVDFMSNSSNSLQWQWQWQRYKIIQSWQYISFQQRDWWCNITLYWLLKRLFQLYSTGERQTKGERRCFLRLKPIVYVYDNVYDKTKNQNHIIFLGSTKGVFRWRRNVFIAKVETISRVQTKFGRDSNPPLNLQLRAL